MAVLRLLVQIDFPNQRVDAVDLSVEALNVAEINIERHQLSHRVFPIQSIFFKFTKR